ncbi:hypothetical protein KTG55_02765 [Acinetobacter pittii]|uniref:hypothetical protein n=1 Tax=Acinetobacter pittii TaxID=48296 RepID=UPI0021CE94E2|nr:hypothetical protein [Acinetobacter pittii]MCU4328717.1 hypothetical protein [Acinetobacter pittii]
MINYSNFWPWLDLNSSELQTLFSFVSLILSIGAIIFAVIQVNSFSRQRIFELKLSVFKEANECQITISELKKNFYAKKNNPLNKNFDLDENRFLSLLENPNDVSNKIVSQILDDKFKFNLDTLEMYLKELIKIKKSLIASQSALDNK